MIRFISIVLLVMISVHMVKAQKTCTSNPTTISSNINFGAITWTASGGATVAECNNMADGLITFTGNVIVDVANNTTITISNNVNITGNFPISGGPGSTLSVSGGGPSTTLHVTGNLGNAASNGVQYNVTATSDHIIVDGTLFGKNNNAFTGAGTISGGTLDVKNGSTCGSPCPVTGGFTSCTAGDAFCTTYLPIVLSYFNVSLDKVEERVLLEWATESEENFNHFEVQRAGSDLKFASIVNVPGAGYNTNSLQQYTAYDEAPLIGKGYYRLKAVDIDGSVEYFKIKSVNYSGGRKFRIYPNPTNGSSIKYTINFEPSPYDRVVLVDAVGNELFSAAVTATENKLISDKVLPSGAYLLRYISSTHHQVARVFIKE